MDENNLTIAEIFKQMQFEKKNLQYKVNYLESRLSSIEENHELVLSTLTESQNSIKSLENKLNLVRQDLKEKENIIDMSEFYKEKILETTQNLSAELKTLKKILNQQNYNEEVELLKNKLSDLEKTFSQQAKEKSKLEFELTNMSEELMFHISNEGNLAKQIKKLEIEKLELKADNKTLLYGNLDDKTKSIDIYERFLTTTPDWDFSTPDVNLFEKDFKTYNEVLSLTTFNKEHKNINLWKEILEVEKKEDMQEKNEDKSALKKYCRTINEFKNCGCNYQDFQLRTFYFPDISNPSQESHISPESNSKQCDSATGGEYTNVICKNVIQLNQPETYSTVKTVSTASQTEFYENVSPVKLSRLDQKNQLKEDVFDKEVQYFSKKEEEIKIKTNCQTFLNYKNCDLDMDIYRSCRKLSVLPEEEIDDIFTKKNCNFFKKECCESKDCFSDDINGALCCKTKPNEIFFSNFLTKSELSQNELSNSDNNFNASYFEKTKLNFVDSELLLSTIPVRDAFRQPRSFESYLDPLNNKKSFSRQISDPTQNNLCTPFLTKHLIKGGEKGSLSKKPGSTCRPLRLPCDKGSKKKEEKMYKVWVNTPEQILSSDINFKEINLNSLTTIESKKNFRMISTFRIDIEDKIYFYEFLEEKFSSHPEHKILIYLKEPKKKNVLLGSSKAFNKYFCDAVEGVCTVKLDVEFYDSNDINHFYPLKKRKKSCFSNFSAVGCSKKRPFFENTHSSIKLDMPCIYFENFPIIKNTFDMNFSSINLLQRKLFILHSYIPNLRADLNLNKFFPPHIFECENLIGAGSSKLDGLSEQHTNKKNFTTNLENFLFSIANKCNEIVQKESLQNREEQDYAEKDDQRDVIENKFYENLNRAYFDVSESSESDTLTYKTVNTHLCPSSSDCDSDTYVTIWSDRSSLLERKYSDFSEDSSSPYTTPPDTSSASFCTPPDSYSPILQSLK